MKLFFFFVFFFKNGINLMKAQLTAEVSGEVNIHFMFDPYFNYFKKSCCKFTQFRCLFIVDNNGYADAAYRGRIKTHEYSGALDVRIRNLQASDAGIYRCKIHGIQNYIIYKDFQVDIVDRKPRLDPVLLFPKSTISTVTSLNQISGKHQEPPSLISDSWSLKHTLGTVFGIVIILIITVILGVAYHKKKAKDLEYGTSSFSSDKCGRSLSSAPDIIPPPQELNSIIYTTVDFKPHEETSQLYANLCLHNSKSALKSQENVEYSTIAVHCHDQKQYQFNI
ncbi:uncharacterized protein LOC118813181 [Colossoma macropomum]|uniref:uncharacterized protein LOC118813181 n=1 Tax=Colossoma macropomum TaxID=42526 RepID=UPI0018655452|nr:uncharacterized protein LOC118813181 [Colossoma macropomum]